MLKVLKRRKYDFKYILKTRQRLCNSYKVTFNREKNKRNLTADEKINQLTFEQKKEIGEFRLLFIRKDIKKFPDLDPLDPLQMMEKFGA